MKKFLLLAALILTVFTTSAKFTIHSVSGKVKLERAGKIHQVTSGMEVGGVDKITVAPDAAIEILNSVDSKVYRCEEAGTYTPTRIMMEARRKADSKFGAIAKTARFSNGNSPQGNIVYSEGCLVTRALETYDPEGATTQIDAMQIATAMATKMSGAPSDSIPMPLSHALPAAGKGLEFSIDNTFDYPVYVNVVKCGSNDKKRTVKISELGQPVGCYIILPGQTLMRRHSLDLDPDYKHILVLTRCYFDIDEVIEKAATIEIKNDTPILTGGHIYITKL